MPLHTDPGFQEIIRRHPARSASTLVTSAEPGEALVLSGVIRDEAGNPFEGALLHFYQTDAAGSYTPKRAMDEPHARLFTFLVTARDGRFEIHTIRPGGYPKAVVLDGQERRIPAHIHLDVQAEGRPGGRYQIVFDDDPRMKDDSWRDWARRLGYPVLAVVRDSGGEARATLDLSLTGRASGGTPRSSTIDEDLRRELLAMVASDQEAREALIRGGIESPDAVSSAKVADIDRKNLVVIRRIIETRGWPGRSLVGEDGAQAAFLLVQHADAAPEFQKRCLPLIDAAFRAGEATGQDFALLTDRVLRADGKPQRYGTQVRVENGRLVVPPVEDEANLEPRRASVGLPPMKEYLDALREVYNLPRPAAVEGEKN